MDGRCLMVAGNESSSTSVWYKNNDCDIYCKEWFDKKIIIAMCVVKSTILYTWMYSSCM